MKMHPIVHVVDGDAETRAAMELMLNSAGHPVRVYPSAEAFLKAYAAGSPGCLVLDLRLPGMSGLELKQALQERGERIPVLIVTAHADVPSAVRAMQLGAVDFLEKPVSPPVLMRRIEEALDLDRRQQAELARVEPIRQRLGQLTPREVMVLELVVEGLSTKEIAQRLALSPRTVENHRGRLMRKMRARSTSGLVRLVLIARGEEGPKDPTGQPS